jgi:hypothetical protein
MINKGKQENKAFEGQLYKESGMPKVYTFTLISTAIAGLICKKYSYQIRDSIFAPGILAFPFSYLLGKSIYFNQHAYNKYCESCQFKRNSHILKN